MSQSTTVTRLLTRLGCYTIGGEPVCLDELPVAYFADHCASYSDDEGVVVKVWDTPELAVFFGMVRSRLLRLLPRIDIRSLGPEDRAALRQGLFAIWRRVAWPSTRPNMPSVFRDVSLMLITLTSSLVA